MTRRLCVAVLLAGCPSASEDNAADTSTGVAETSTGPTTTVSMSDTTPTTSSDPTTMSSMSMSATDTDDTDATTETGPTGCVESDECTDPANPVCEDGACVPCTQVADGDAACAEKDLGAAACGDDGACVECTPKNAAACEGTTPVCDAGSSSCVGCTYHEQCDAACSMATGACFGDCVNTVRAGQDIQDAAEDGCVVLVGAGVYAENLVIDGGISVAILGVEEGVFLSGGLGNGTPALAVSEGANVFVQNLQISGSDGIGVGVSDASLWLDRSEVVANNDGAITLTSDAYASVRNCFVRGSPDATSLLVDDTSSVDVVYAALGGSTGDATALGCAPTATVTVRNSIVVGRGDSAFDIMCDAEITHSATEVLYPGAGNVALGELTSGIQNTWFVNYLAGDFHLNAPPSDVLTAAQWNTGDPATDIDGDLRPDADGTADVAGADVPQ